MTGCGFQVLDHLLFRDVLRTDRMHWFVPSPPKTPFGRTPPVPVYYSTRDRGCPVFSRSEALHKVDMTSDSGP